MNHESHTWLDIRNETSGWTTSQAPQRTVSDVYYVRGVANISLALITSLGNGLVIFLFVKDPNKKIRKSPTNVLVTSLAVVDFVVGFVLEPAGAYWFLTTYFQHGAPFDGKYLQMAEVFLLLVSVFHLLGITRDRHLAVLDPLVYSLQKTIKKRSYATVITIWLYCLLLVVVLGFVGKHYMRNIVFCLHVDLALVVSVVLFCCVMRSLRKQTVCLQNLNAVESITIRSIERERKVTKIMGIMLGVFLTCTLPWFLMMQILPFCSACKRDMRLFIWLFKLFFILFQANCAFNPFFCALRLPKYKAAIKYIFCTGKLKILRKGSRATTSISLQRCSSIQFNGAVVESYSQPVPND